MADSELQRPGWSLVWSDEFNGAAGSPVDAASWQFETGADRSGNQELQYYTDDIANAALDGAGNLAISVHQVAAFEVNDRFGGCAFTSARVITKNRVTCCYGWIEARIQLPVGVWPAFWMLGTNIDAVTWPQCGEIDVMENFGRNGAVVHGTVHGPGYAGQAGITAAYTAATSLASDFHRYAVEWEPYRIRWYVDDVLFSTVTPRELDGRPWVFDHPFYLLLNVAVGGEFSQPPDGSVPFPQTMRIDYVRIFTATR